MGDGFGRYLIGEPSLVNWRGVEAHVVEVDVSGEQASEFGDHRFLPRNSTLGDASAHFKETRIIVNRSLRIHRANGSDRFCPVLTRNSPWNIPAALLKFTGTVSWYKLNEYTKAMEHLQ